MSISIDQLKPGDRLSGLASGLNVTISRIEKHGDDAVSVIYTDDSGVFGERMLFRDQLQDISFLEQTPNLSSEEAPNGLTLDLPSALKLKNPVQERRPQPASEKEKAMERLKSSTLFEDFGFLFTRARALWVVRDNASFLEFGLRGRSYAILSLATSGQNPTQRELADFLVLDASQIVAVIDDLEKRGCVERRRSPTDKRTNIIVATEAGRKLHEKARAAALGNEQESGPKLSSEERAQLLELMKRVAF
jgi:DNA-binding MarR family transcriptional regulator